MHQTLRWCLFLYLDSFAIETPREWQVKKVKRNVQRLRFHWRGKAVIVFPKIGVPAVSIFIPSGVSPIGLQYRYIPKNFFFKCSGTLVTMFNRADTATAGEAGVGMEKYLHTVGKGLL